MTKKIPGIPNGIIIVAIWMIFGCIVNIILSFLIVKSTSLNNSYSLLILSVMLFVSIQFFIVYGLLCGKIWSWILMFIVLFFDIIISFTSYIRFEGIPPAMILISHMFVSISLSNTTDVEVVHCIHILDFIIQGRDVLNTETSTKGA